MSEENQTCADKVYTAWLSRLDDLQMMLDPTPDHLTIDGDNPDNDIDGWQLSYGETSFEEVIDAQGLFDEHEDEIREAGREAFNQYALAFDYVAPGTFNDQKEGYWRYQISWGGPSEEIRFYASKGHDGWHLYKAEFWYLDWFDGARTIVTDDSIVQTLWEEFEETGTVQHTYDEELVPE